MIAWKSVEDQLKRVGCNYLLWGRTETRQLSHVLMHNEKIMQAVNGYYDGGFALLCVTNYRILVVDKKPFLFTVEDLRYDMIAEADYSSRIITAVLHLITPMRRLDFTSWSMERLRNGMNYIQQRVMELRNNEFLANQFEQFASEPIVSRRQSDLIAIQTQQKHHPQTVPTYQGVTPPVAQFDAYTPTPRSTIPNPYTKIPLLARRRRYPMFY